MTHRFEYHFKGHGDIPSSVVVLETDAEALPELVEAFQRYLQGCGYCGLDDVHLDFVEEEI